MQRLNRAAIDRLRTATVVFIRTVAGLIVTIVQYVVRRQRRKAALPAENLFLRKQLALFQERETKPRRAGDATRASLPWLIKYFSWRDALVIVTPATLIRWHREGFRLFWRLKSRPGRPAVPPDVQQLIRRMALDNPTWREVRIAHELLLKLGLRLSPRTVRKYMPDRTDGACGGRGDQRWATFVRNHAAAIVACDFFAVVTASFKVLYVFIVVEHATRRIIHVNVTAHPSSDWTLQQLREAIPGDHSYRFLIRDQDSKFGDELDRSIRRLGLSVLKTPVRTPVANAICERTIGTIRRGCLDYLIPITGNHLRSILRKWVSHFNAGRPHSSLGPGIPDPPEDLPVPLKEHRHRLPSHHRVTCRSMLGGLHHEYALQRAA